MKKIFTLLCVLALTGCANMKFQVAFSYKTDNLAGALEDVVTTGPVVTAPKEVPK